MRRLDNRINFEFHVVLRKKKQYDLFIIFLCSIFFFLVSFLFYFKYEAHKISKQLQTLDEEINREKKLVELLEIEFVHLSSPYRIKKIYENEGKLKKIPKERMNFYDINCDITK